MSSAVAPSPFKKPLTSFCEFKLSSSHGRTASGAPLQPQQLQENALSAPMPAPTPVKSLLSSSSLAMIKRAECSTPRAGRVAPPASVAARQSLSAVKPRATMRRTLPAVPLFSEAATPSKSAASAFTPSKRAMPPVPLFFDDDAASEPCAAAVPCALPTVKDADDSFDFDLDGEDEFKIDGGAMSSILNDDAWKEDSDSVVPLPGSSHASALAPSTPRRVTLSGQTAQNLLTPRGANRGSIFGGALRTPVRTKPADLARTPAARLTISGALPCAAERKLGVSASSHAFQRTPSITVGSSFKARPFPSSSHQR